MVSSVYFEWLWRKLLPSIGEHEHLRREPPPATSFISETSDEP